MHGAQHIKSLTRSTGTMANNTLTLNGGLTFATNTGDYSPAQSYTLTTASATALTANTLYSTQASLGNASSTGLTTSNLYFCFIF